MGGHHERRSPKFALNSTFTISTTLNPATSFALFPQQRRVRAVAAGQREAWWVAHHPPASSAQHTNHQSANNSKQTQTSREPQLLANLQQGETTWKFPCFFLKVFGRRLWTETFGELMCCWGEEAGRQWKPVSRFCHLHSPRQPHLNSLTPTFLLTCNRWKGWDAGILHEQPPSRENAASSKARWFPGQRVASLTFKVCQNMSNLVLNSMQAAALFTLCKRNRKPLSED